jgi:hypothetical protein
MKRAKFSLDLRQLERQIRDVEGILSQIQLVVNTALSRPRANLAIRPRATLTWQMTDAVAQRALVLQRIFSQGMTADLLFAFCPTTGILNRPISTFTFLFRPTHLRSAPRFEWNEANVQISPVTDQALGSERYK